MRLSAKFLAVLILLSSISNAQVRPHENAVSNKDSARHYQKVIGDMYRQAYDSLRHSEAYLQALEKYKQYSKPGAGYYSVVFFAEVTQADFGDLNKSIAPSGFGPLKGPTYRLGMGFSWQFHNRCILDFNFFALGLDHTTKKGNESIKSTFADLFQFNFGYDFIKSPRINIYPYVGLSLRGSNLSYNTPAQTNPNYTSIVDIVENARSVDGSATNLGYQAGLGLEYVLHERKKGGGTIFFVKVGTNRAFGNQTYSVEDVTYDPKIRQGDWIVTAGFKFFARR